MLTHLRLTVPTALVGDVERLLVEHPYTTNVTVSRGASLKPVGDLVEVDVARERAADLLDHLHGIGVSEEGGIVVLRPQGTPFREAERLERLAPGHPDDAVIWEAVISDAESAAVPTISYHAFLLIAVALAAIAVVTDSAVLVVGAMVVGPEFGAIAALSAGLVLRRPRLVGRAARLLLLSFTVAVAAVTLLALLARGAGILTAADVLAPRPNTGFIWHPDIWSFVVAVLAGAAGALALALDRANALVGVFISVTTVPAAGNLALGIAIADVDEINGSLGQLGLNVAGMVVSGVVVLLVVRFWWPWLAERSSRLFGHDH
ncbi:DUF389 domain-containing protein [Nocardioides sp.]|uniref:DUF389 domain-containing protein n=1 Tax=Nocardioides sp. TaxID=35761 RepID=UPI0035196A0C